MPKVEVEPVVVEQPPHQGRQQRRAKEQQTLKRQKANDRSKAHFRLFETFIMTKSKRERAKKAAGQKREQTRVERVEAKAKPLYPKKETKEQETNASK